MDFLEVIILLIITAAELDNRSDHNIGKFQPNPSNAKKIARIYI